MGTDTPIIYTGKQFRKWRKETPTVTIAKLAELSGCTESQISNFENEKTDVTRGTMSKLQIALSTLKNGNNEQASNEL